MNLKIFKKQPSSPKIWRFKGSCIGGKFNLFGVNIFNYDWESTGKQVIVTDPHHHLNHTFRTYTVNINGKTKEFAAGEFSNNVWGFYI